MGKQSWISLSSKLLIVLLFISFIAVPLLPGQSTAEEVPAERYAVSVTSSVYEEPTPVTGIEIWVGDVPTDDDGDAVLLPGQSAAIDYEVYPMEATDPGVTWSTEHPEIASVDENGTVTGVSLGRTTLTLTTSDGQHTDTIGISVVETDAAFEAEFSKGIVSWDEYVAVKIFKTSDTHDVTHFQVGVRPYDEDWDTEDVVVVPHDNIAEGTFEFNDDWMASGTIADGVDSTGRTELFTIYLRSVGMPGYGDVRLSNGHMTDSAGIDHYAGIPGEYASRDVRVPFADPNYADAAQIVEHYGLVVDWPEPEITNEIQYLDMNRDGIVDMKDLVFVHVRSLDSWFDPDAPDHRGQLEAPSGAQLLASVSSSRPRVGEQVQVTLDLAGVDHSAGIYFELRYDPARMELDSVMYDYKFQSYGEQTMDESEGLIAFALADETPMVEEDDDIPAVLATFTALQPGAAPFTVEHVQVVDYASKEIAVGPPGTITATVGHWLFPEGEEQFTLRSVSHYLQQAGEELPDWNGDGEQNKADVEYLLQVIGPRALSVVE